MSASQNYRRLSQVIAGKRMGRRDVLRAAARLGLSAPVIAGLLAACGSSSSSSSSNTAATTSTSGTPASPSTTISATPATTPAEAEAEGELKLLYWEGPNILNYHFSSGGTDGSAARLILEPLADFDSDGKLVPVLAQDAPSLENGGVAKDGKSVTWKLKPGVTWSDGEPFTAKDVKFTWEYVTNKDAAAASAAVFAVISSVDVLDDLTVRLNFSQPTPAWFNPFVGYSVLPQHLLADYTGAKAKSAPFNLKPIGTGPFVVDSFVPGDHVIYTANPTFREPDKPHFAQVSLKGGGNATTAAQAVFQSGEVDFAWNLQLPAQVLSAMITASKIAHPTTQSFNGAEMIMINFSDPNTTVDQQRSHLGTPHPFQADLSVRQAYALAVQRDVIAKLYGPGGTLATNVFVSPPNLVSQATSWNYDLAQANALLDKAGWNKDGDGTRAKGSTKMKVSYSTTTDTLRQQEQEIVKAGLQKIGVDVTLKSIDGTVFFSSNVSNPNTFAHFYVDLEMFLSTEGSPYPIRFAGNWYGAASNVAQRENDWTGSNVSRWQNADYDAAYKQALTEMEPSKQDALFQKMNDLVVNNVVVIPLVTRNQVNGLANSIKGSNPSAWAGETWDIANWRRE